MAGKPLRIDIDGPDVDMWADGSRLTYRGEPFTGEVAEYSGDDFVSLDEYVQGRVHGSSRAWHYNGRPESEGVCVGGRAVGLWRAWHENGVLASEQWFSDDGWSLLESRAWDEQGRPVRNRSGRHPHPEQVPGDGAGARARTEFSPPPPP
ncbi:hypothetical protein ABT354_13335 [Streptomyces sp. NPDC000594]|uniref:toxin-antitoxin system YwqK family antitoxin n=1 Tax=Streptomyces sp. NPDC000594 TaxID=3154261 RepID=UPI00331CD633